MNGAIQVQQSLCVLAPRAVGVYQTLGLWGAIAVIRMRDRFLQLVKSHVRSNQWSSQRVWLPTLGSPGSLCHCPQVFKHVHLFFILCSLFLGDFPQRWPMATSHPLPITFWQPSAFKPPFVRLIPRVSLPSSAPGSSSSCQFLSDIGCNLYEMGTCPEALWGTGESTSTIRSFILYYGNKGEEVGNKYTNTLAII